MAKSKNNPENQSTDIYKKAAKQAKKEFEKAQVAEVKEMVLATLEAIETHKAIAADAQKKLKLLKADLKDLELGRIHLIKERQKKDDLAKDVSKIEITKLDEMITKLNYPVVTTNAPYTPPQIWYDTGTGNSFPGKAPEVYGGPMNDTPRQSSGTTSFFSEMSSGTYKLSNGTTKYIGGYK